MIDPRAIIDPSAVIGADVRIDAWAVIGEQVEVGDEAIISSHVVVQAGTRIGAGCRIGPQAVIGNHPLAALRLDELEGCESLLLGEGSTVCALSRVTGPVAPQATVSGDPAQPVSTLS